MAVPTYWRIDEYVKSALGPAVAGAQVYFLTQPANAAALTPQAQLYADPLGQTLVSQPLIADGFGHVSAYVAPGTYTMVVALSGILQNTYADQTYGLASASGSVPASGNSGLFATAQPGLTTAPSGDVLVADGSGNVSDSGVNISNVVAANANTIYVGSSSYPLTNSGIQAAINAATQNGTVAGCVVLPVNPSGIIPISTTITVPSNCSLQGPGKYLLELQATASFTGPVMSVSNATNVALKGFKVDGNRVNNSNSFDALYIYNSTWVFAEDLAVSNSIGNGLELNGGGSHIFFENSDFFNNGPLLPSVGDGIVIDGGLAFKHVQFLRCKIHSNNIGVQIYNPQTAGQVTEDIVFAECQVYSNANDGLSPFSSNQTGGTIVGLRFINNEVYSNGWPANGVGFSSNTPPGLLQTGPIASSSGVGIDILSIYGLITQTVVSGNRCHDNVYDGIAIAGNTQGTVNTSGTSVSAVTGSFNVNWKNGQYININGVYYQIASVASSIALTLQTSAGTQTGVVFTGSMPTHSTFVGNISYNNGNQGVLGTGFWNYYADYNTWAGNVGNGNNLEGFGCIVSYKTSYANDKAFGNDVSAASGHNYGWLLIGAYDTSLVGISTDDVTTSPTQTVGVLIQSNCSNTSIQSNAISGSSAAVSDSGVNTSQNNGTIAIFGDSLVIRTDGSALSAGPGLRTTGNGLGSGLMVESGGSNPIRFNWEVGTGGVIFSNGLSGIMLAINANGIITSYGDVVTAGNGVPSEVGQVVATGLTANYNSGSAKTVFTPTAASQLRISYTQAITTAGSASSTFPSLTLGWTDSGGIARTKTLVATSTTNTTAVESDGVAVITTNASTAVTITSANYAASTAASMVFALSVTAEQL